MERRLGEAEHAAVLALELLSDGGRMEQLESVLDREHPDHDPVSRAASQRTRRAAVALRNRLENLDRRENTLSSLLDTALALSEPDDLQVTLKVITRRTRMLLGLDIACVATVRESAGGLSILAASGHLSPLTVGLRISDNEGLGRRALSSTAPVWSADFLADDRFTHSEALDDVVRAEGVHALIAIPLLHGTRRLGVLYAGDRHSRSFSRDDVALMGSIGELSGAAIARAIAHDERSGLLSGLRHRSTRMEKEAAEAHHALEVGRHLMGVLTQKADLTTLTTEAAHLLDASLRVCAPDGGTLTEVGVLPSRDPQVLARADVASRAGERVVDLEDGVRLIPILPGPGHPGYVLFSRERDSPDPAHPMLRQVGQVFAAHFALAGSGADAHPHENLLPQLLEMPTTPAHHPASFPAGPASRTGKGLGAPHVVVVVRPRTDPAGIGRAWASSYARRNRGTCTVRHDDIVLLLPGTDPRAAAEAATADLIPMVEEPPTVSAAGPVSHDSAVAHTYREALRCVEAMTALGTAGRTATAPDLGIFGVLLSPDHDIPAFVASTLGPLIRYDQMHLTELVSSLEAYFGAGGSPTHAAKLIHVHPNTVSRRLERIGDLLGPDWQLPECALQLQIALRLHRLQQVLRCEGSVVERVPGAD